MASTEAPASNGNNSTFLKWALTIIGGLLVLLVSALWDGNARLAVVEENTGSIKEVMADHETRMRRLERRAASRGLQYEEENEL